MAFNAGGVFSRLYNWVADRDAGINITASRMDAETDGMVQGLNQLVDGTQPFKAPVRSSFGTAATPGHSFDGDINTGMYRPAEDQIGHATAGVQRTLLTTTAYQVDVPMTGTAVTASATDTTAGRLLKVGDFGVGAIAPTIGNASVTNNSIAPGLYTYSSIGGSTGGPGAVSNGTLLHTRRTAGGGETQTLLTDEVNGKTYFRSRTTGAWNAWRTVLTTDDITTSSTDATTGRLLTVGAGHQQLDDSLYRKANIVGSVSQSGGVPTGSIIQSGQNANGAFVRYADGTQMCWRFVGSSVSVDVTAAFAAAFSSSTPEDGIMVALSVFTTNVIPITARYNSINNNGLTLSAFRADTGARIGVQVNIIAIGRWY